MRKIKNFLIVLISIALIASFSSCGDKEKLSIKTEKDVYQINIGSTFTLPDAQVVNQHGDTISGYQITHTVKDPSGNQVNISDNTFDVTILGDYKIIFSASSEDGKKEIDAKEIIVRCKEGEEQEPLSDVTVSQSGIITFTQSEGETYSLYVDGVKEGSINSGGSIREYISSTPKSVGVKKDARSGYKESALSNTVSVSKRNKVEDLTVSGSVISFTYDSSYTYSLNISGMKIDTSSAVTENFDVKEYLNKGINAVYLTVDGYASDDTIILSSDDSNYINITKHDKIKDCEISSEGEITFTAEKKGFSYRLIMPEPLSPVVNITNNMDISEYLDQLQSGDNTLYLEIIAETPENNKISYIIDDLTASECNIYKYVQPDNVEIDDEHIITFNTDQGSGNPEPASYSLYIDNIWVGNITSGQSIYNYYGTKSGDMLISVCADSDSNGWRSVLSSTGISVSFPGLFKGAEGNTNVTSLAASSDGVTLMGKSGAEFVYSEEISLKDLTDENRYFIDFRALPINGEYNLSGVKVYLIDAENEGSYIFVEQRGDDGKIYGGFSGSSGTNERYGTASKSPGISSDGKIADINNNNCVGGIISYGYNFQTKTLYYRDNLGYSDNGKSADINIVDYGAAWNFHPDNLDGRVKIKIVFECSSVTEGCVQVVCVGDDVLNDSSKYFDWNNGTATVQKKTMVYTTATELGTNDSNGNAPLLDPKGVLSGYMIQAKSENYVRYKELLSFDDLVNTNIVEFGTNCETNLYSGKYIEVRLVDAADTTKILAFKFSMSTSGANVYKYYTGAGQSSVEATSIGAETPCANFGFFNTASSTIVPMIRYNGNNQLTVLDKAFNFSDIPELLTDNFGSEGFYVEFGLWNDETRSIPYSFGIIVRSVGGTLLV